MSKFPVTEDKERALRADMARLGIRESDLQESFVRGAGPGGQKINKTSVVVFLKHRPSGTEVKCQRTRSQALNRFFARRLLCEKISTALLGEQSRREQEREKIRRQKRRRSRKQKEKMLQSKHRRTTVKKTRSKVDESSAD